MSDGGLRKILETIDQDRPGAVVRLPPGPTAVEYSPLLDRAPDMLAQAMNQICEVAAARALDLATEAETVAMSLKAEATVLADELRALGASFGNSARDSASLVRDVATEFKALRERVVKFRVDGALPKAEAEK